MSAIGKTASITLITGLPGSGKTLRTVHFIKQAVDAGEVVFVCNLNGLKLPHIPFEDPRKWRELPAGSVLVVDEAQQFFRTRRGGDAPEYLTAMETIRHQGVRLIVITQQPDYLDTHLRGLVGLHEHLVRVQGKEATKIFRHDELMDNVRSEKARGRYDSEVWAYPTELFHCYESAQVHTVKKVMTARMKRGLMIAGVAALVIGWVGSRFYGFFDNAAQAAEGTGEPAVVAAREGGERPLTADLSSVASSGRAAHDPEAIAEYVANLQPRVAMLPWSAPIYDGRQVAAEPRVFCMDGGAGYTAQDAYAQREVRCVTEQGSRHVMPDWQAERLAREGEPYNPYKQPVQAQGGMLTVGAESVAAAGSSSVGIGRKGQVPRYGQFRDEPLGPEKYEVQGW